MSVVSNAKENLAKGTVNNLGSAYKGALNNYAGEKNLVWDVYLGVLSGSFHSFSAGL